ncbi:hypothetical protein [Amycolatopsis sp. cg9]|uniref:hypothetical protein n=1 Tax=Amycolatopsis sp. cg9 TaxID=3238801 RepID=UPI003525B4EE
MSSISALVVNTPVLPYVLAAATTVGLLLMAAVVLTATLHTDHRRRADARRVLSILLSALTRGRGR